MTRAACPVASAPPQALAAAFGVTRWTYAQLDERVRAWHARLRGHARVAVCSENSLELLALLHAAGRAGTALLLLNTRLTARERLAQLAALGNPPLADELAHELAAGPAARGLPASEAASLDPGSVQTLLFTSGTTGVPKVAPHTVQNHQANARAAIEVLGLDAGTRFVCCLPLFHVGGVAIAIRCALAGGAVLLHERFDAAAVAQDLRSGATHASLVASTLARVLDACDAFPPGVRAVLVGGGPVPSALLARARGAGLPVLQTYGLTETSSQATCERPGEADGETAGPPMPGLELRVTQDGEIEVRGPAVIAGYLGAPAFDGWFATGDLGTLDARGRLVVHARRVDLILSGGENVYPAEVEAALLLHPGVREAAVLPAPDERWGQVGVAHLVAEATEPELRAFLRARLAAYKVPARFHFRAALPKTAAGKVDRAALLRAR